MLSLLAPPSPQHRTAEMNICQHRTAEINICQPELIFGATAATGGRVKMLSTA